MSDNLKIQVKGLETLIKGIKDLPVKIQDKVDGYLSSKANDVRATAVSLAPISKGKFAAELKGSIDAITGEYLNKKVIVRANYAAYVEFGTGPFAKSYVATLPEELQKYAREFFVSGEGHSPAQPFLFPAFFQHLQPKKVEKDLKRLIEGK